MKYLPTGGCSIRRGGTPQKGAAGLVRLIQNRGRPAKTIHVGEKHPYTSLLLA